MTDSPFSSIIITVLVIGAAALAMGTMIIGTANSYNATVNSTVFSNLTAAGNTMVGITNQSSNNFFGNKTSTTQLTAVDRMIGTAYSTILVIGNIPGVFVGIVDTLMTAVGLPGYGNFVIAAILAIIIGIAIYLAVGRR